MLLTSCRRHVCKRIKKELFTRQEGRAGPSGTARRKKSATSAQSSSRLLLLALVRSQHTPAFVTPRSPPTILHRLTSLRKQGTGWRKEHACKTNTPYTQRGIFNFKTTRPTDSLPGDASACQKHTPSKPQAQAPSADSEAINSPARLAPNQHNSFPKNANNAERGICRPSSSIRHPSSSFQVGQDLGCQPLHRLADLGVAEEVELIQVVVQLVQLLSSLEPIRFRDLFCF